MVFAAAAGGSMPPGRSTENGVLGATGVVAGNLALAAGASWLRKRRADKTSAQFSSRWRDGRRRVSQTLNRAALWRLPVLFVCENNGYAEFTSREEHSTSSM